jgi:hypothetical protein
VTTDKPESPWQWPSQWVRDEGFWRDVASRGTASFVVVVVGYVFATSAGYISTPGGFKLLLYALTGLAGFAITASVGRLWFNAFSPIITKKWGDWRDIVWIVPAVAIMAVPIVAGVIGFYYLIGVIHDA